MPSSPYLIAAVVIIALQAAAIVSLLVQRTRRAHADRVLRESEARFRTLAEQSPVMIWATRPDTQVDYFNATCAAFTGRSVEELLGNGWLEGVHPDDVERCQRIYVPAFEAGVPFRMDFRIRVADGSYRWIVDHGVPRLRPDGSLAGYVGASIDITERKEAEEALRASQERHTLATAAGDVGVWDWRVGTSEIFVDAALTRLLGFEDADIPPRLDAWRPRIHPDDLPAVIAMGRCDRDTYEFEHRLLHRDGRVRWFLSRGAIVRGADGAPSRIVGTSTDITERRRAAELIRESQAALEVSHRQVQDLAGRLIEAQDAERARVARDLHDDVSQQLAGLAIAFSGLKRRMSDTNIGGDFPADLQALQQRTQAIAQSVRLVSHDLHPSVLEHVGLVSALTAYCGELASAHGVTIECGAEGDVESIAPDAALCLYRIAQEALRNVVAHAGARRAGVTLLRTLESAEIMIVDDGRGFDLGSAHEGGKGLGLVSITERVRLSGGTVSLVTGVNRGTRVRARIPAGAPKARSAGGGTTGRVA